MSHGKHLKRDHSENITDGVETFRFSLAKSGHHLSQVWQNLGTPPTNWQNLGIPYI